MVRLPAIGSIGCLPPAITEERLVSPPATVAVAAISISHLNMQLEESDPSAQPAELRNLASELIKLARECLEP